MIALVVRSAESYEVFERMHWVCFHYPFEHFGGDGDPYQACRDPACPARSFDLAAPPDCRPRASTDLPVDAA